jgi:hypothetical protein
MACSWRRKLILVAAHIHNRRAHLRRPRPIRMLTKEFFQFIGSQRLFMAA